MDFEGSQATVKLLESVDQLVEVVGGHQLPALKCLDALNIAFRLIGRRH